jgi:penicillin-binding protein 2
VTPHLGTAINSPSGHLLVALPAPPAGKLPSRYDAYLPSILAGLHLAAQGSRGTSDDVFSGFPLPVYGKTGTAQLSSTDQREDQSWYVAYVADGRHSIVVAVTIEKGGYGDDAAAPAARLILAKWFGLPETVIQGTSTSR